MTRNTLSPDSVYVMTALLTKLHNTDLKLLKFWSIRFKC